MNQEKIKSIHVKETIHSLLEKRAFQHGKRMKPFLEHILVRVLRDKKLLTEFFKK